jgi:hypothetical protein
MNNLSQMHKKNSSLCNTKILQFEKKIICYAETIFMAIGNSVLYEFLREAVNPC